jgi:hypothetical protein
VFSVSLNNPVEFSLNNARHFWHLHAASAAGGLFLIVEMDTPFSGLKRVSSVPLGAVEFGKCLGPLLKLSCNMAILASVMGGFESLSLIGQLPVNQEGGCS